jgi:hypothetical protein
MNLDFRHSQDFWAGLMLIGTGVAAVLIARNYSFGTALRMGPGYFPSILGGLLALAGLYLTVKGLRSGEKIGPNWSLRAIVVLPLALVLFGILMEHAGFVPALAVLIFGSAAAGSQFNFVEVALLTVLLTAASVVVFVWGLGLPYPLLAGF